MRFPASGASLGVLGDDRLALLTLPPPPPLRCAAGGLVAGEWNSCLAECAPFVAAAAAAPVVEAETVRSITPSSSTTPNSSASSSLLLLALLLAAAADVDADDATAGLRGAACFPSALSMLRSLDGDKGESG